MMAAPAQGMHMRLLTILLLTATLFAVDTPATPPPADPPPQMIIATVVERIGGDLDNGYRSPVFIIGEWQGRRIVIGVNGDIDTTGIVAGQQLQVMVLKRTYGSNRSLNYLLTQTASPRR